MQWRIPGTLLEIQRDKVDHIEDVFASMTMAGGMVLSQVTNITGLEPHAIHNWVKRGFLPSPQQKRYSLGQVCRIIQINMLKNVLPMERIVGLLGYVNGELDKEEDDIIDDARLYFLFVRLAARAKQLDDPDSLEEALNEALKDYTEPVPGAKERVEKTLRIMLISWVAAKMRSAAEELLENL